MPSRRRSRNKSIAGNITDVQKRLRYLETRPAPSQLARKVVATKNIALRAVEPDVIADAAVVRRTLAPESVISANLSVVGDPDGAAVATENVQDTSITNEKLAGDIEDGKIIGISASKVGPDLLVDDQLESISASKVGPDLLVDDQIEGISTEKLIGTLLADQLAGGITSEYIDEVDAATITVGLIQDEQIDGISGEKIIGGIDGNLIVAGSVDETKISGVNADAIVGNIQANQIEPNSLTEDQLDENSVGYDELQANSVDTIQLRGLSVVDAIIDDLAINRRHLNDDIIISRMINNGAVQTAGIQNLAVTNAKIADGAVTGIKIADSSVTSTKLGAIGRALYDNTLLLGTGLSRSWPVGSGGDFGINLSVSSGANSVAVGNHTHGQNGYTAAGSSGVPSHTHPISINDTSTSNGDHSGHSGTPATRGAHTHVVGISGNTGTPSTIKLKKEVTDYSMVDVKNLLNLNLKRYKYKNQARHLQEGREWMYGYIAEEVKDLGIEEIVGYDENKEPNAINYGLLSTLVLELVKVQQTEIDSLKEEIQRLKEKI
jgi:hypothetical protein